MKKKYYLVNTDYQPLTWDLDRGYLDPIIQFNTRKDAKMFLESLKKCPDYDCELFIKKTVFEGQFKNLSGFRPYYDKKLNEIHIERWKN